MLNNPLTFFHNRTPSSYLDAAPENVTSWHAVRSALSLTREPSSRLRPTATVSKRMLLCGFTIHSGPGPRSWRSVLTDSRCLPAHDWIKERDDTEILGTVNLSMPAGGKTTFSTSRAP